MMKDQSRMFSGKGAFGCRGLGTFEWPCSLA